MSATEHPEARTGAAELRVRRALTLALGLSVMLYLLADLAAIRAQAPVLPPGWNLVAVVGQATCGVLLLAVPWFSTGRAMRLAAAGFALFGIGWIAVLIPIAGFASIPPSDGLLWLARGQTSYTVAAFLAFRRGIAWIYLAALSVVGYAASWLTAADGGFREHAEVLVVHLSTVIPFALTVILAVGAARAADVAATEALDAVLRDSASAARALERRRVELLAHDEVLAVLRAAAGDVRPTAEDLAKMAAAAEAGLARLLSDAVPTALSAEEFVLRIRDLCASVAPYAHLEADSAEMPSLPDDVQIALLDACGEALRNSVAHAGDTGVRRVVALRGTRRAVTVTVVDDGRGFRRRDVSGERLGVARSIEERMRALSGGSAVVTSTPGTGTRVELTWQNRAEGDER